MLKSYTETFRELFKSPRNVTDPFIHGEKGCYMHPFTFCLAGALLVVALNTLFIDFGGEVQADFGDLENESVRELAKSIQDANLRASTQFLPLMMILVFIPLLSIPGAFFFRDQLEGFYSNLVLNTYACGTSMIALLPLIPVWAWIDLPLSDPFMSSTLPAVLVAGIVIWIYNLSLDVRSGMGWVRLLSSYISGYILFALTAGLLSGVAGYMIFAIRRILELAG